MFTEGEGHNGDVTMSDAVEFRKCAEECMQRIERMSPHAKPILLSIAEAWLALAHDAECRAKERIPLH